jgi:ABC-type multidrug transport system ATPase subunit
LTQDLEVVGLRKEFAGRVLLDVDLKVRAGAFCVLLGENGAGKTTLLRCLLGLERHGGVVRVGGARLTGRAIGILDAPMLYPRWSVRRNVQFALNRTRVDDLEWVRRLLPAGWLSRRAGRLSAGQTKLVLLAIALSADAGVILLDEFSNGLDQGTRERVRDVLREARARRGRTIVATGHDLRFFEGIATQVLTLRGAHVTDVTARLTAGEGLEDLYAATVA